MRIVTLEEHFQIPELIKKFNINPAHNFTRMMAPAIKERLDDIGDKRVAEMDLGEVTVQVLSAAAPGAEFVDGDFGVQFAKEYNDAVYTATQRHPNRLAGFAHLPVRAPEAAADELERCVTDLKFRGGLVDGTCEGLFLDHPKFAPILARAEKLDVPIYIHPAPPPEAVRKAYYDGLPGNTGMALSAFGYGWHIETAIHVMRLAVSGTLLKFPNLKIIIGHMGETIPFMLERSNNVVSAQGIPLKQLLQKHLWITTSGFFTIPPFLNALQTFGADRILYSVDYPFSQMTTGLQFLKTLPVSSADLQKIASGNADRLLKLQ